MFRITIIASILIILLFTYLGKYYYPERILGDGYEYLLSTEALSNHGNTNITTADVNSIEKQGKIKILPNVVNLIDKRGEMYRNETGFWVDKHGDVQIIHFITYSLFATPFRMLTSIFSINPMYAFFIFNTFCVLLVALSLIVFLGNSMMQKVLITLCLLCTPFFWYVGWVHAEVFISTLLCLGFLCSAYNYPKLSIAFFAIATTQNTAIIPFVFFVVLYFFIQLKLYMRPIELVKYILLAGISFLPLLFFKSKFNVFSLNTFKHDTSINEISFHKFSSLFFDLNQGMIIAYPIVTLLFIGVIFTYLYRTIKTRKFNDPIYPVYAIAIIFSIAIFTTMKNWNHGGTIVNRYSFYIGALIFCIVLHYFHNRVRSNTFTVLLIFVFLTQLSSIVYHFKINLDAYNSAKMKPYAAWVLNNYPALYSPVAHIFYNRILGQGELNTINSPVVWLNGALPTKLLVHTSRIDDLLYYGFSNETILDLKKKYASENEWVYIPNDRFPKNIAFSIACRLNYINIGMKNIASNYAYYKSLCKKAESLKKECNSQIIDEILWGYQFKNPFDEINQLDNKYINDRLDFTNSSAQQYFENQLYLKKVESLVDTVKRNKEMMEYIKKQASERNESIEESVFNNAKYLVDQQIEKK